MRKLFADLREMRSLQISERVTVGTSLYFTIPYDAAPRYAGGPMPTSTMGLDFAATRLGVLMRPQADEPHEAWGVINPGAVRSADGTPNGR